MEDQYDIEVEYEYEAGERENHLGVREMGSIIGYSTFEHCTGHPGFGSRLYKITTFLEFLDVPNHVNQYYVAAEELDNFFIENYETGEKIVDVRPIHVVDAVEEMWEYDEDIEPWGISE